MEGGGGRGGFHWRKGSRSRESLKNQEKRIRREKGIRTAEYKSPRGEMVERVRITRPGSVFGKKKNRSGDCPFDRNSHKRSSRMGKLGLKVRWSSPPGKKNDRVGNGWLGKRRGREKLGRDESHGQKKNGRACPDRGCRILL